MADANKMTVEDTLMDLVGRDLISFDTEYEETEYLAAVRDQHRIRKLMKLGREYYRAQNSTVRGILETYDCAFTPELAKIAGVYHIALTKELLEEADVEPPKKETRHTMAWWGRYAAIAIPAYSDWRVVGFWLIKPRKDDGNGLDEPWAYLDLVMNGVDRPMGYANAIGIHHAEAFVVENPIVAMRMNLRQLADGKIETPFVVPRGIVNGFHLGSTKPVYFPTNQHSRERFYHAAMKVLGSESVWFDGLVGIGPNKLGFNPLTQFGTSSQVTSAAMVRGMSRRSLPAHQVMGNLLLSMKTADARKVVSTYSMTLAHQNQIMGYFSGEELAELQRLFDADPRARTIDIDGKLVTERPEGWYHGNKLVSDVTFFIEEVVTDTVLDSRVARGVITYHRQTYRFEEDYDKVRKNTAKWLEDMILRHSGSGIPVITAAWKRQLLRIAMGFKTPERATPTSRYGWQQDGNTLCMPHFSVSNRGIYLTETNITGPRLAAPVNVRKSEWQAFEDPDFATVAMALLMNMLQTRTGVGARGILFANAEHVVEKLASGIRDRVLDNPDIKTMEAASKYPLPLVVSLTDDARSDFMRRKGKGATHVAMSVPRSLFRLLKIHGGWYCIDILDLPHEQSLRLLFPLLRHFLEIDLDANSDEFFYTMGAAVSTFLFERGIKPNACIDACRELESNGYAHPGNSATLILAHLWWGVRENRLRAEDRDDMVVFDLKKVRRIFTTQGAPSFDLNYMARLLTRGNLLMRNTEDEWGISKTMWDSYGSLLSLTVK